MFCQNCGKEIPDDSLFCGECGATTGNNQNQNVPPPPPAQQFNQPQYQQPFNQQGGAAADNTKLFSILSYIGILFVVGLIAEPKNQKLRFHVNQGCVLFLAELVLGFVVGIFNTVLYRIPVLPGLLSFAVYGGSIVLAVLGIMNAVKGEEKELPVIGTIRIIK